MDSNWKQFEDRVYDECCWIYGESHVKRNVHLVGVLTGVKRQVDVLVELDGECIAFDAKYYKKKVDVKEVESLIGMYGDLGVNKLVIVTNNGYTQAALSRAFRGNEHIVADILSVEELKFLQVYFAIGYAGKWGVTLKAPFGWIIDAKRTPNKWIACMYQRGFDLNMAGEHREWMYLNLYDKTITGGGIEDLISEHRDSVMEVDPEGKWSRVEDEFIITCFDSKKYPSLEVIGYRDMGEFILFCVLYCQSEVVERNVEKLKSVLRTAIGVRVRQKQID